MSKETTPNSKDIDNNIIFSSNAIQSILNVLLKYSVHGATPVLIQGETGVGKELFVHYTHKNSVRRDQPLHKISCTMETKLLERQLFGYTKNSNTKRQKEHKGLLQTASAGTLYFEEIYDLDISLQAKLFKAFETSQFIHPNGREHIAIDARIIMSTNHDLEKAVADGTLNPAFYSLLQKFKVTIPPLRDRPEDIIPLTKYYLHKFNLLYSKSFDSVQTHAENILNVYSWPGNIRELRNFVERVVVMENDSRIRVRHLPLDFFDELLSRMPEDEKFSP